MKKLLALVSVIAMLLMPIASMAEAIDPASVTGKIVMYTSDPEEIVTEALQAFTAKYPNVTYELFRSGTGNLTTKLKSELEAGGTTCNVFSFADFGFLYDWDEKGLIYHWTPEAAANLANEAFKVGGDLGYIYHIECGVIAYNTVFTPEPPKDWFDLTNENLRGLVAFADPGYSGASFSTLVTHVYNEELVGWDFYEQMKANDLKFEQSNGNLQSKVASGEYSAVAIVDYMARNARDEGAPVEVVYPESGAVMIWSPVCIVSTVKEEDLQAVKLWVEFLLSDEGQAVYTKNNYLPVTTTAPSPEGAPTPAELNLMPFDGQFFVDENAEIRAQFESIFAR